MRRRQGIGFLEEVDPDLKIEREVRRREANWEEIEKLPPLIASAVKLFIELGDLRLAQRISGLDLEDFIEVLERARVPIFITVRD